MSAESVSAPGAPADPTSAPARPGPSIKRIAFAAFTGSMVEFYDMLIYGYAASLVFAPLFFPELGDAAGTVASFATLGVAFFARPFGSLLFGHFGDRLGRKRMLVTTMMMMGTATILVGVVPTTAQIGVWAPIILVFLRIVQGIAGGGEVASAYLFVSENAPKARRGFWTSLSGLGGAGAIFLASLTMMVTSASMSAESFASWGWRIPFLASIVLIGIGMWVRLSTEETVVFRAQVERGGRAMLPIGEAIRRQPRELLLAIGTSLVAYTLTYLGATYLTNYGAKLMGLSFTAVLGISAATAVVFGTAQVVGAIWSDKVGRRRVIMVAAGAGVVWSLVLFPLLETQHVAAFVVGLAVTMYIAGTVVGPIGAFLSELFHTRYRATAAGFSYQTAAALGGGIPPLIGAAITPVYGGVAFGVILALICGISLFCILRVKETQHYELDRESASGETA